MDEYQHLRESADEAAKKAKRKHRHDWRLIKHEVTGETYAICPCGAEVNLDDPVVVS